MIGQKTIYKAVNSAKTTAINAAKAAAQKALLDEPGKIIESAGNQIMGQSSETQQPKRQVAEPNIEPQKIKDEQYRNQKWQELKSQLEGEIQKARQKKMEDEKRVAQVQTPTPVDAAGNPLPNGVNAQEIKKNQGFFGKIKSRMQGAAQKMGKRERKQGPSG